EADAKRMELREDSEVGSREVIAKPKPVEWRSRFEEIEDAAVIVEKCRFSRAREVAGVERAEDALSNLRGGELSGEPRGPAEVGSGDAGPIVVVRPARRDDVAVQRAIGPVFPEPRFSACPRVGRLETGMRREGDDARENARRIENGCIIDEKDRHLAGRIE